MVPKTFTHPLSQSSKDVIDKYGSAGEKMPEDVAQLAGTERYVEYDRMGRVVRGQETKVKSRYEEDVLINNHTAVWGSWWKDGTWGFACCQQCVKNSYCTGSAGAAAIAESDELAVANMEARAARSAEEEDKRRRESKLNDYQGYVSDVWGADTAKPEEIDPAKVSSTVYCIFHLLQCGSLVHGHIFRAVSSGPCFSHPPPHTFT